MWVWCMNCVCVSVSVYMYTCTQLEDITGYPLCHSLPYSLEIGFSLKLGLDWGPVFLSYPPVSAPLSSGVTAAHGHTQHFTWILRTCR